MILIEEAFWPVHSACDEKYRRGNWNRLNLGKTNDVPWGMLPIESSMIIALL